MYMYVHVSILTGKLTYHISWAIKNKFYVSTMIIELLHDYLIEVQKDKDLYGV